MPAKIKLTVPGPDAHISEWREAMPMLPGGEFYPGTYEDYTTVINS